MELKSFYEAYVFGLDLAIKAPTDKQSEEIQEMLLEIQRHLTAEQIYTARNYIDYKREKNNG